MPKSNNQRFKEYYYRIKQGITIPTCNCGRPLKGNLSKKRLICKACYDLSDDKRHKNWLNKNKVRDRQVLVETLQEWGNYKVDSEVKTPDGSVGVIQAIASYIDGSVDARVVFNDGDEDVFLISSNTPSIL